MSECPKYYPALLPILGLMIYIIIYTLGALEYSGGSYNFPSDEGYSFNHNLLCDLMLPISIDGVVNGGKTLGIISHIILGLSMMGFFYFLPIIFSSENRNTKLTRYFGMASMFIFAFMFSTYHDMIVILTGIIGTIALIPFFIELKKYQPAPLLYLAYACFLMSVLVFLSFLTKIGYYYLPLFQKFIFVLDAVWVVWVCLMVYRNNRPFLVLRS